MQRDCLTIVCPFVVLATAALVASCSGDGDSGQGAAGAAGSAGVAGDGGGGASDAGTFLDGSYHGDGGDVPACDENVRPVYVLARGATADMIHRCDPATLTFSEVVQVQCPDTADWSVTLMAIDRSSHAWIEWGGPVTGPGERYAKRLDRVDLATGDCQIDQGKLPVADGPLGMAFVTDTAGSSGEHLFFIDKSTKLYALGGTSAIGQFYQFKFGEGTEFSGAELTGTGAGRLFVMITNWTPEWDHPCTAQNPCSPTVHLGEIDKGTGAAISNVEVPDVEALGISSGGIAFAHWGGHFWFMISKDFGPRRCGTTIPFRTRPCWRRVAARTGLWAQGFRRALRWRCRSSHSSAEAGTRRGGYGEAVPSRRQFIRARGRAACAHACAPNGPTELVVAGPATQHIGACTKRWRSSCRPGCRRTRESPYPR